MVTYATDDNENVIDMHLLLQYCVVELDLLLMYALYTLRSATAPGAALPPASMQSYSQVLRLVLKQNLLYQCQGLH